MRATTPTAGPAVAGVVLLLAVPACAAVLDVGPASGAGIASEAAERALLAAPAHGAAVDALGDDLDVAPRAPA